jgi:hypothetical protein
MVKPLPKNRHMACLSLAPGTWEFEVFHTVKGRYVDEVRDRQKRASVPSPCETDIDKAEMLRAGLLALERLKQNDLPEIINMARKRRGRPSTVALAVDDGPQDTTSADSVSEAQKVATSGIS